MVLVLFAYAFLGEFANILYWTKEAFAQKGKNIKLQKNIMSFYVIKLMENYFWMEKEKFLMLGIGILFWQFFFCRWRFF